MLYLNFSIVNPFAQQDFNNIFSRSGQLTENKCWEIEIYREPRRLLGIEINLEWRGCDHAGPGMELSLFGHSISIKVYDVRHWNSKENTWVNYDNSYDDNPYDYQ